MKTLPSDAFVVDEVRPPQRSLRVALVTETYPPEVNGVATTVAQVVDGLRRRGHEVQLVRPRQGKGDEAMHDLLLRGLPIPRYPHLKMGLPAKKALVQHWSLQRPDVVHIATEGPLGWSALQAALHLKLPVTSDFRTNFHAYSQHYGVGWLKKPIVAYLRKFHNRCAQTMVPTAKLRDELAGHGFQRLEVVARGVDTLRFHPRHRSEAMRRSWGVTSSQTQVVLHVGRLAAEKNLELLLRAFEAIRQRRADTKLVLVGDGPQREALRQSCPHAHFAGSQQGHELAVHYASADVFLFPSVTETFGNVTPEAMASGLALLAYRYAAAEQLVRPGVDGLLAPLADDAEFVRLAGALAANPAAAREMGRRARQSAEGLDWERVLAQIEGVFSAAMQRGARPEAVRPALAGARSAAAS